MSFLPVHRRIRAVGIPGHEGEDNPLTAADIKKLVEDTVNGTVNSAISNLKKTDLPKLFKEHIDPVTAQFAGIKEALDKLKPTELSPPATGTGTIPPEVSAELKNLKDNAAATKKQMDQMQQEKEAAELKTKTLERHTKIRTALAGVKEGFANDSAPQTAFMLVEPLIKELDDGTLVGGDNLPVEDFVKDYLPKQHPYLLKPTGAGGAGAAGGGRGGGSGKVGTIEMIKPGMTAEERTLVLNAIQAAGNRQ